MAAWLTGRADSNEPATGKTIVTEFCREILKKQMNDELPIPGGEFSLPLPRREPPKTFPTEAAAIDWYERENQRLIQWTNETAMTYLLGLHNMKDVQ